MELRPATREEFADFSRAAMAAFHRELSDEERERYERIDEPERSLAWFDDGRIVATTGAFTRELTVPGAFVPCAAVTAVAVLPTHRRRGLLRAMMRRQLDDLHERGDPVAILWASEGTIYGRFGYGVGGRTARLVARRPAARLPHAAASEPLRAGPAGEHVEAMRGVHDRVRPQRPGMLDRRGPWWGERLFDPESERNGAQPLQAVVVDDGYALYAVRPDFGEDGPAGAVVVRELVAATPAAYARLWAFLLDQDLTATITWDGAPVDEPLWLALTDPRALRTTVTDGLWVRLVDVAAALGARSYAGDPDVVIEVADGFCAWNAGRYRLSADGCKRTDAAADLALDVADLAAVYLGGTTLSSLAAVGRLSELTPGAVASATVAFRGDAEPWCPEAF
jgi:predicted acetyltransferase